jgi:hypothetical protein
MTSCTVAAHLTGDTKSIHPRVEAGRLWHDVDVSG